MNRDSLLLSCLIIIISFWGALNPVYAAPHPLVGTKAPELKLDDWYFLEPGQKVPRLKDYKDKVVYLYCYQSWCPGCHKYGFPALKKISDEFKDNSDIAFFVIQTVFEGFSANTPNKIEQTRKDYKLKVPFAHDDGDGKGATLMRDYRTRGTPWHIIIDKQGRVVFCDFHVDPDKTIAALKELMKQ